MQIQYKKYRFYTADSLKTGDFILIAEIEATSEEIARNEADQTVKKLFKKWVIILTK